jgi:hypothetical protein
MVGLILAAITHGINPRGDIVGLYVDTIGHGYLRSRSILLPRRPFGNADTGKRFHTSRELAAGADAARAQECCRSRPSGWALTNDSSWLVDMRVWLDEKRH